jgi:uncharacterized protein (DUF1778 family)
MPSSSPQTEQGRIERLEARITSGQKVLLKQAAEPQGRTLSDFVAHAASEAAMRIVEEHKVITLTAREQAAFVEALLNPPKPGPRLRAAARRYRKVMA